MMVLTVLSFFFGTISLALAILTMLLRRRSQRTVIALALSICTAVGSFMMGW
jgi:hypothetical protein